MRRTRAPEALDRIVADVDTLREIPALLLWGPSDPVFSDIYLRDLEARLPRADVHRFVGASHLVPEEADVAGAVHEWVAQLHAAPASADRRQSTAACRRRELRHGPGSTGAPATPMSR